MVATFFTEDVHVSRGVHDLLNAISSRLVMVVISLALVGCSSDSDPIVQPKETTYGDLSGYVFLKGTSITLSDVIVTVGDRSDTTLERGKYRFDSIPDGDYVIVAAREDYATFTDSVIVAGVTSKDIMLEIGIDAGDVSGHVGHPVYKAVGGAEITIGDISGLSKPDGSYLLRNVPVGAHEFTCNHPSYHPLSGTVLVDSRSVTLDITLIRTVIDTIPITEDATIAWSTLSSLDANTNFGFDAFLSLEYKGGSQDIGVRKRALISLPPLPAGLDSKDLEVANLVLRESALSVARGKVSWVPESISLRRVISPWIHTLVTWNTAPRVSDDRLVVVESESRVMVLDVRFVYQDTLDPRYGLRLALLAEEESSYHSGVVSIHSCDSPEPAFEPYIAFKYTH